MSVPSRRRYSDVVSMSEPKLGGQPQITKSRLKQTSLPIVSWADLTAFTEEESQWWADFEAAAKQNTAGSEPHQSSILRMKDELKSFSETAFITSAVTRDETTAEESKKKKAEEESSKKSDGTLVDCELSKVVQSLECAQNRMWSIESECLRSEDECDAIERQCLGLVREQAHLGRSLEQLSQCVAHLRECHSLKSRLNNVILAQRPRLSSAASKKPPPTTRPITSTDFGVDDDNNSVVSAKPSEKAFVKITTDSYPTASTLPTVDLSEVKYIAERTEKCRAYIVQHSAILADSELEFYTATLSALRQDCISTIRRQVFARIDSCESNASDVASGRLLAMRLSLSSVRPLVETVEVLSATATEYSELLSSMVSRLRAVRYSHLSDWLPTGDCSFDAQQSAVIKSAPLPSGVSAASRLAATDGGATASGRLTEEPLLTALQRLCAGALRGCLLEAKLFGELFDLSLIRNADTGKITDLKTMSFSSFAFLKSHSRQKLNDASLIASGFGEDNAMSATLLTQTEMCSRLYDAVRPRIIHEMEMTTLCDVIALLQHIVKENDIEEEEEEDGDDGRDYDYASKGKDTSFGVEHKEDSSNNSGILDVRTECFSADSGSAKVVATNGRLAVCGVAERMVADAQERLVYRTQIVIRDMIAIAADNDDYDGDDTVKDKVVSVTVADDSKAKKTTDGSSIADASSSGLRQRGAGWHSVVQCTLDVLSSIYPVLQRHVFEWLSFECVSCCVHSLLSISRRTAAKKGSIHGQLFLVKHLLILREQIAPFKVQLCLEEHCLDFGHMAEYARELMTASGGYSLVQMLTHSIPTVAKHRLNTRKAMEDLLKRTCESLISAQTNLLIGALIEMVRYYADSQKLLAKESSSGKKSKSISDVAKEALAALSSPPPTPSLAEESSAAAVDLVAQKAFVDKLNGALQQSEEGLVNGVQRLADTMAAYLRNPSTRRILLRPIVSNIQNAFIEMRRIVAQLGLRRQVSLTICDDIVEKLRQIASCQPQVDS